MKVLSTRQSASLRWATSAIPSMSVMIIVGLAGVSRKITFTGVPASFSSWHRVSTSAGSVPALNSRVTIPLSGRIVSSKRSVPP